MNKKYWLESVPPTNTKVLRKQTTIESRTAIETVALFYDLPLAQKVCDLLNETSRSQGVWPKNK